MRAYIISFRLFGTCGPLYYVREDGVYDYRPHRAQQFRTRKDAIQFRKNNYPCDHRVIAVDADELHVEAALDALDDTGDKFRAHHAGSYGYRLVACKTSVSP